MIEQARITAATPYSTKPCASCAGTGFRIDINCEACAGHGVVLVYPPAIKCPRCEGTGGPTPGYAYRFCIVCRGSGWALVVRG